MLYVEYTLLQCHTGKLGGALYVAWDGNNNIVIPFLLPGLC